MNKIFLIACVFILSACSDSEPEVVASGNRRNTPPVVGVKPKDIELYAIRDYQPNFWQSLNLEAKASGRYQIPERLDIIFGNSARGWASLRIAERVFCYRGNATSTSTLDGDAFILQHEKNDMTKECNNSATNMKVVPYATIQKNDLVRLHITGGGCSSVSGACLNTAIAGMIELSEEFFEISPVLELMSYPDPAQLEFDGVLIADLNRGSTLNTTYGSVRRGRTLNYVTLAGREYLILGEDGLSAAECETNANYPDHGVGNDLCQTVGAENFDRIILCTSSDVDTTVRYAQEWTSLDNFMQNSRKGLHCWVNGSKLNSTKIFVY